MLPEGYFPHSETYEARGMHFGSAQLYQPCSVCLFLNLLPKTQVNIFNLRKMLLNNIVHCLKHTAKYHHISDDTKATGHARDA